MEGFLIVLQCLYNTNLENIFILLFLSLLFIHFLLFSPYFLLFLEIFQKESQVGDKFVPRQKSVKHQRQICGLFSLLVPGSLLVSFHIRFPSKLLQQNSSLCSVQTIYSFPTVSIVREGRSCLHSSQEMKRNDCCVL